MLWDFKLLRLIVFIGGLALMFAIESIKPTRPWHNSRKSRLAFHLALAVFNNIILKFAAVIPLLYFREYVFEQNWGLMPALGIEGYPEVIASLVILDMLDYWWHRFNHRIPFLWRFHKVHHVDTHVDVTTSLRFHPGELMISALIKSLWILTLGPSLLAFAIFESATTLAAQFHHTNIDFPDSVELPLRKILVTPRYHTSHHTVCRRTGDENFAVILICWDKLFATYQEPDYEEMKTLGLKEGRDSDLSFTATLKDPFTSSNSR